MRFNFSKTAMDNLMGMCRDFNKTPNEVLEKLLENSNLREALCYEEKAAKNREIYQENH